MVELKAWDLSSQHLDTSRMQVHNTCNNRKSLQTNLVCQQCENSGALGGGEAHTRTLVPMGVSPSAISGTFPHSMASSSMKPSVKKIFNRFLG